MTFEKIYQLLKLNTTVKLITADNAPLIISFLFKSFKQNQSNTVLERDLVTLLTDFLFVVNQDESQFPRKSKEYLTDWTNAGFLRKHPSNNDEFVFELTPATENGFKWIDSLEKPQFVGTDSRLKNLFEKLKELSIKTKRDYETRFEELKAKQKAVEQEIEDLQNGKFDVLDDRQIKEQYLFIEETAKYLLADFRQVEENFRTLDRNFRKKIITTSQTKGKVLEDLFQQQDFLLETDQGKSFNAFWEFLLSQSKQDEFEKLIEEVLNIPVVQQMQKESFSIDNIRNNLIDAGDKTKKTTNSLLEQLRKYLEHKSFFENKRIHDNITEILKVFTEKSETDFSKLSLLELDEIINIDLIVDRPLYNPPQKIKFANKNPEEGKSTANNDLLFEQFEINIPELKGRIKTALKNKTQISFPDFVKEFEIQKGVAEVVAYIEIASKERNKHLVDESIHDIIDIKNAKTNKIFTVKIPQIVFCR
jgi:cell division protein FtsB